MKQILNTLFIAILAGLVGFFVGQRFPNAFKSSLTSVKTVTKTNPVEEATDKPAEVKKIETNKFSRTAVIQINPLGKKLTAPKNSRALMTKQFFQTQFHIILSNETITRAINDYRLNELWGADKAELIKTMKQQLKVEQVRGTDLMEVKGSADNDEKAQQLVYAMVMTYQARRTEAIKSQRNEVIEKYN